MVWVRQPWSKRAVPVSLYAGSAYRKLENTKTAALGRVTKQLTRRGRHLDLGSVCANKFRYSDVTGARSYLLDWNGRSNPNLNSTPSATLLNFKDSFIYLVVRAICNISSGDGTLLHGHQSIAAQPRRHRHLKSSSIITNAFNLALAAGSTSSATTDTELRRCGLSVHIASMALKPLPTRRTCRNIT